MSEKEESFITNRELIREIHTEIKNLRIEMTETKTILKEHNEKFSSLSKSNHKWFERGLAAGIATVFSSMIHFIGGK